MSLFFQKQTNYIYFIILLYGLIIPYSIASDCDVFANVINLLGGSLKNNLSRVNNCCDFSGITCDTDNRITEM